VHNAKYLKVQGYEGLVRDTSTGAIINTNRTELDNYLRQKEINEQKNLQLSQNTEDINSMKNDLQELKSLIYQLLNTTKGNK
jgi:hypothetical protein